MANPVEEALMAKEAFLGGVAEGMRQAVGTQKGQMELGRAATRMAFGAAAMAAIPAAQKVYDAITKRRDFKEMMQTSPGLSSVQTENPSLFNAAYSSFRRINPTFAKDPVVAGSYMRKIMASPESAGLIIAQTVKSPSLSEGMNVGVDAGPFNLRRSL